MASKNTSLYGWCFLLAGMSSASGALPFYGRVGHLLCSHQLPVCVTGEWSFLQGTQAYQLSITQKKRALCLGRRYEKMLLTHSFLFCCVSQPPPLRGTSFHRKEGEPCPCIAFPYCHFERKREIFFVCGQEETGEHRKMGNTVLHTLLAHGVSFAKETASGQRKALSAASMRRGFL